MRHVSNSALFARTVVAAIAIFLVAAVIYDMKNKLDEPRTIRLEQQKIRSISAIPDSVLENYDVIVIENCE